MMLKERFKSKKLLAVVTVLIIWLSFAIASTPLIPEVDAAYANREYTDSWGDSVKITANYNIGGGHIDYKAVSGKNGVKFYGITLGTYVCSIKRYYIYLKCYDSAGNVIKRYSRTYYPNRCYYRKTVSVPSGTVRIYARMTAKFMLLISPFPTRTIGVSLYA